jgi:hypothetical protein
VPSKDRGNGSAGSAKDLNYAALRREEETASRDGLLAAEVQRQSMQADRDHVKYSTASGWLLLPLPASIFKEIEVSSIFWRPSAITADSISEAEARPQRIS